MVSLRLKDVSKQVRGGTGVQRLNLNVSDGELFVIAGPPGSGKSLVLRLIAGLETPDEGEIYLGDERITHLPPHKRGISMVFQSLALYPNKTVFENIAFPLRVQKVAESEIRKRVKDVAAFLRIDHILDKYPRFLSGGEQQRVALARAMILSPKLFLFDQPLANLDAIIRVAMRDEIRRIVKEVGTTTVYITHENVEALSIADRIAYMEKGRIIDVGTPIEFLTNPKDFRVARYFSDINFIESRVEQIDGRLYARFLTEKVPVPVSSTSGGKVILVFKMSDVMLGKDLKLGHGENKLIAHGEVTMIEERVRGRICSVRISENVEVRAYTEQRYELGDKVDVEISRNRISIYDHESMARLA
ncbi:MAG: ABC transporter ATP-binding protein [Nitrososphaerota archaeon]